MAKELGFPKILGLVIVATVGLLCGGCSVLFLPMTLNPLDGLVTIPIMGLIVAFLCALIIKKTLQDRGPDQDRDAE